MPTLEDLGFEIERAPRIFHRDTTMPDESQLGYIGDPNSVVNGNTPGESLLYNAPSGTKFVDKTSSPYEIWEKIEDTAGGVWVSTYGNTTITGGGTTAIFSCNSSKFKNRYLNFAGRPSNIVGLPIMKPSNISKVQVMTQEESSGWVRIRLNNVNYYSIQLSSSIDVLKENVIRPVAVGDTIQVYVESSIGMSYPIVQLFLE
jgi:hypothetical protein